MGLVEAAQDILIAVVLLLVISIFIVAVWPDLVSNLGNAEVFPAGLATLGIIGLIPLTYLIGLFKRMFTDISKRDDFEQPRGLQR